ncbi:MAG: DNA alkylation repair protein [Actinomycetota bacterium]|nr:DNA alkylation repair protein [Actinomycetota bacterium]
MDYNQIIAKLKSQRNPAAVAGMARYGINPQNTLGVSVPNIRTLAKRIGKNHELALKLWASGVHEARMLAAFIDDHKQVDEAQMERWVADFDSWDVCDQTCGNLFDKTPWAYAKAAEWAGRPEEFVKRAGFVMMACLAVHDKKAADEKFLDFLPIIKREASDDRNLVKKAVNWALRQIGKRNIALNKVSVAAASDIRQLDSKPARWIATDALRELTGEAVQQKLQRKH